MKARSRKSRTFWVCFDPALSGRHRFNAFPTKSEARAEVAESNDGRDRRDGNLAELHGPYLIYDPNSPKV